MLQSFCKDCAVGAAKKMTVAFWTPVVQIWTNQTTSRGGSLPSRNESFQWGFNAKWEPSLQRFFWPPSLFFRKVKHRASEHSNEIFERGSRIPRVPSDNVCTASSSHYKYLRRELNSDFTGREVVSSLLCNPHVTKIVKKHSFWPFRWAKWLIRSYWDTLSGRILPCLIGRL